MEGAPDIVALNEEIKNESAFIDLIQSELRKVIVGQNGMVEGLLIGLLANGHILLEGVPGLAKTLAINSLSKTLGGSFFLLNLSLPSYLNLSLIGQSVTSHNLAGAPSSSSICSVSGAPSKLKQQNAASNYQ